MINNSLLPGISIGYGHGLRNAKQVSEQRTARVESVEATSHWKRAKDIPVCEKNNYFFLFWESMDFFS